MRRLLLAPPVLMFALVPVGCGGSADVTAPPSTPPPVVSSGPTSPTASAKPESAKAFIRRWVAVTDAMESSGDTRTFDALSGPGCRSCASLKALIAKIYSNGGVVQASPTKIISIKEKPGNAYQVREQNKPSRYRDSAAGAWKQLKGGRLTELYTLGGTPGNWRMAQFGQLAGSAR